MKVIPSILAIAVCGGIGGLAGWRLVTALGWSGVGGALAAAAAGMTVATLVFAGVIALWRVRHPNRS